MPLQRRVPKFGFKNINRVEYQGVGLSKLQELADAGLNEITFQALVDKRVVSKNDKVKILANGSLNAKVSVTVHKFTSAAKAVIEASGGTATSL